MATLTSLNRVICGGAAPPRALIEEFERRLGAQFIHAYGMTEGGPLTHVSRLKHHMDAWDEDRRYAVRARQGILVPGLEMRVVDWNGADVPQDGTTMGELGLVSDRRRVL